MIYCHKSDSTTHLQFACPHREVGHWKRPLARREEQGAWGRRQPCRMNLFIEHRVVIKTVISYGLTSYDTIHILVKAVVPGTVSFSMWVAHHGALVYRGGLANFKAIFRYQIRSNKTIYASNAWPFYPQGETHCERVLTSLCPSCGACL